MKTKNNDKSKKSIKKNNCNPLFSVIKIVIAKCTTLLIQKNKLVSSSIASFILSSPLKLFDNTKLKLTSYLKHSCVSTAKNKQFMIWL